MFGLLISTPSSKAKFHAKSMDKQILKARKKFFDADQWISDKGFTADPLLCKTTAAEAVKKSRKRLAEAMCNADEALKSICKLPDDEQVYMMLKLTQMPTQWSNDAMRLSPEPLFHSDEVKQVFKDSYWRWDDEFGALVVKYRLQHHLELSDKDEKRREQDRSQGSL